MSVTPTPSCPASALARVGETDQAVPFQCRPSGWKLDRAFESRPTAQASAGPLALTEARVAVFCGVAGVATCDHAVPFQWSMSTFAPTVVPGRPSSLPTAQASVSDVEVTLARPAFTPVGGMGTVVQAPAASAGLAASTTAVPIAIPPPILPILEKDITFPFRRAGAAL